MNLIGIDFEDWYHPELVQKHVRDLEHEPSMFKGLDKIIDMLRRNDTSATFFVVGELLEKNPEILDKILENGHEVGFHTMYHEKIDSTGFEEKFSDLPTVSNKAIGGTELMRNWLYEHMEKVS